MTYPKPHSALREWRRHFGQPVTIIVMLAAAIVLTLVGPFDTDERLRFAPRAVYWAAIVVSTYSVGFLLSEFIRQRWRGTLSHVSLILLTGLATGTGVSLCVIAINYAAFAYLPSFDELPALIGTIFPVAVVIALVFDVLATHLARREPDTPTTATPPPPPLLDRLPLDKRGRILALSVEDHYVRIQTDRGQEVVLMRLGDAIRETGDIPGLQVHRSHWVATDAVAAARREGDRAILTLTNQAEIPVSRRYVPQIREAGLLPR